MSDFNKPTAADSYATDLLPNLRDNVSKCATMNFGGATNIPINTVQFQAGAFARWNGLNWVPTPISVAGGGLGGTSLTEARTSLNVNEKGIGGGQVRTNAESDLLYTPQTRQINVSGAVTGGGTLEDNVNITVRGATTSQTGVVQLNNTLTSTSTTQALTAAQGKILKDAVDSKGSSSTIIWSGSDNTGVSLDSDIAGGYPGDGLYLINNQMIFFLDGVSSSVVYGSDAFDDTLQVFEIRKIGNTIYRVRSRVDMDTNTATTINLDVNEIRKIN